RLRQAEPKNEAYLYLDGAVTFYEGDYAKAQALFAKVKNLKAYEQDQGGMAQLAGEILATGLVFQSSRTAHATVRYAAGPDEVMVEPIQEAFEKIRATIDHELGFAPPESVVIEIYPTSGAFIAASPLTEQDVKTSGTVALCKYGRVLLTTPRSLLR